ncbi:MAG: lysylphosphatidylglycerol synthase transmembrane domain-containing protein [Thermodesulfobacteriota bacterium]
MSNTRRKSDGQAARGRLKTWLRVAVSAGLLGLLFTRFDLGAILRLCLRATPGFFFAAFVFYLASQLVSALRWRNLARGVGFGVDFTESLQFYAIGMFFGLVVPSTIGSDASRALYLGNRPPGRAAAFSSVLFDRLIGLVMLAAVAAVALLGPNADLPIGLEIGVLAICLSLTAGWFSIPFLVRLLPPEQRWRRLVEEDLLPFFRDPLLLASAAGLSLGVHVLQIVSQKLLTDALGLYVPFGFVAMYHPLVALAAALPFTIGGFGLREAAYAALLPYGGVSPDDAIALGLLWWTVAAVGGLGGGVVYALSDLRMPSLRRPAGS